MVERFLPSDDPIAEEVLEWTLSKDAGDAQQLLDWFGDATTPREKRAMLKRVKELVGEMEFALDELIKLQ